MATLFLGVNIGGASVAQGATLQHKSTVVTKKPMPKSTVSTINVSKVNSTKKSTFRPLVTKPAPKPVSKVSSKPAAKPAASSATTKVQKTVAPKPVAKTTSTGVKSTASKVVKTSNANSIQANTAVITRNKVGSVVTPATERIEHVPNVRVLLGSRSSDAKVTSTANMVVLNSNNGQVSTISANRGTSVGVQGSKIVVNGKAIDSVVTLKPANSDAPFLFEGKGYRGGLTLRANNGKMMVINSVAARTYALHTMEENKGKLYDVSTSTDHQVYNGVSGETQATTNAVNKTKGMVMLYNQRPINALFHSDGGGYTEDSVNVWGSDVPYLKGVKDFSTGTSTSNWTVTTSRQALESKLNAASKGVGKLKSIQLTPLGKPGQQTSDRGVSGRIKSATFIGTSGKTTIDGDSLRSILGLKSTLFDFYVNHNPTKGAGKAYHNFTGSNDTVYIKGHGWGHGLGMSQWGAAEMAKRATPGDTNYYQTILRHYYSGITLKKMY